MFKLFSHATLFYEDFAESNSKINVISVMSYLTGSVVIKV